jgi:predicted peroxiredoxin
VKLVYVSSTGSSDETTASIPFHLAANGSVENGQETAIFLVGHAADLVVDDAWKSVEGTGLPPLRDLLQKLREHSIPVYV